MSSGAPAFRLHLIFVRGLIWAVIGAIYAPLFAGLHVMALGLGLDHFATIPAAALAGAAGAALYGARQVALAGTLLGLMVGAVVLLGPGYIPLWQVVLPAVLVSGLLGAMVRFPTRCSLRVPGKVLAGLAAGVLGGTLLALVEPLHPQEFHVTGILAFLVSANGILYVASARWWMAMAVQQGRRACMLTQSAVIAVLAGISAGSLWVVGGPFVGAVDPVYADLIAAIGREVPYAVLGGVLGGGVAGAMLEAFRFPWALD